MAARVSRRGLRAVLGIIILVAVHLVYSFAAVGASLLSIRSTATAVLNSSDNSDISELSQRARRIHVAGVAAAAAVDGLGMSALGTLPGPGSDVGLVRFLGHGAGRGGDFALDALAHLYRATRDGGSLASAIYRDEKLDFDVVRQLGHLAGATQKILGHLANEAGRLDTPVFEVSQRLHARVRQALSRASDAAAKGRLVARMLPLLAAEDARKIYLVAFQSPSEARGSGGLIGVYGILEANDGAVRLTHVGPHSEIGKDVAAPVSAPGWYRNLYGGLLALNEIRHANLGTHFPTVARVVLAYYRAARNQTLDGVIAVDPIVLEQVTSGTPPLRGPGWDVEVDADNARKILLKSSYLRFGQYQERAQDRFLEGLMKDLLGHLRTGRVNAVALARGMMKAANWQHLKLWTVDPALNSALRSLGLTGDLTRAGPNVQEIFHNNFTGSKVDYFLRRDQETVVEISEEGDAEVTTSIILKNRAPTEPSSLLIRPLLRRYPNGHNRMTLSFLMPRGASFEEFSIDGKRSRPLRGNETGYPVAWNIVDVPPGATREVTVIYELPDAVDEDRFALTLWPQALVRPDNFRFELRVPEGTTMDVEPPRRLTNGNYVLDGRLFGPKKITARLDR